MALDELGGWPGADRERVAAAGSPTSTSRVDGSARSKRPHRRGLFTIAMLAPAP